MDLSSPVVWARVHSVIFFVFGTPRVVSGMAPCIDTVPGQPTELPDYKLFPGADAAASHAGWPCGRQPPWLSEWTLNGSLPLPCQSITGKKSTVVFDAHSEWPGACASASQATNIDDGLGLGLLQVPEEKDVGACQAGCVYDAFCSVWQFRDGACYRGVGIHCWHGLGAGQVATAQRLMHGAVRVLIDLKAWRLKIRENFLVHLGQLTYGTRGGTFRAVDRCRAWCHSNIKCQYWQVDEDEHGEERCWVETQIGTHTVPYPLTAINVWRANITAGEYIQHFCPASFVPLAPAKDAASTPYSAPPEWVGYCLAAILVILALFCVCRQMRKRTPYQPLPQPLPVVTRTIRKPEPQKQVPLVVTPVSIVPQVPSPKPRPVGNVPCPTCRQPLVFNTVQTAPLVNIHCNVCGRAGCPHHCLECSYFICDTCFVNEMSKTTSRSTRSCRMCT